MHINAGELRAATLWVRVMATTVGPRRWRFLDLTDSMVSNGILARGRASSYQLNREARRRAGWEGLTGMIFASAWVDTLRQPCDPGTRPDLKGALNISCPQYMKRRLFVEIYAGCAGITFECKRLGVETESSWDIEYGVRYDLTIPTNRRRLMRLLGS